LISDRDKRFTSSPKCVDWLWGSLSLLLSRYWGALLHGVKWPSYEADHSPLSSYEVEYERSYAATPLYACIECKGIKVIYSFGLTEYVNFHQKMMYTCVQHLLQTPVVAVYSPTTCSQCFSWLKKMAKELIFRMHQQMCNVIQFYAGNYNYHLCGNSNW
jgi:hypothetical protein